MKHYWNTDIDDDFKAALFDFKYRDKNYHLYSSDAVFSSFKADLGSLILTSVLIEEVEKYIEHLGSDELKFFNALDVGCGNGLISILLSDHIPTYKGDMIDVSLRALNLSEKNIKHYQFSDRLFVFESDKYDKVDKTYDVIFTNPPIRTGKENVHQILAGSKEYLKEGGLFFAVIRKSHGAKSALNKLKEIYSNCEIIKKSKGYYILCSKKN